MYEFWYDYVKPNLTKKQNYVMWIEQLNCSLKNR